MVYVTHEPTSEETLKILSRLFVYKAHLVPYQSIMCSMHEVRARLEQAESEVIAEMDAASIGVLTHDGKDITVVTGADAKRFLVITDHRKLK